MNILVFPKATNPYQDMLYREMRKFPDFHFRYITFQITRNTVANCLLFPLLLIRKRIRKYSLIHIHWLYEFQEIRRSGFLTRLFFTLYVFWIMFLIKMIRYTVIYTVHDTETRDHQFLSEKTITIMLLLLSDRIIALSDSTANLIESLHIPGVRNKLSVIPHGNYIGWYANSIGTQKARRILGIPETSFVLLYFGIIRQYKGVQDLLVCLEKIIHQHNMVIVLAGACYDGQIEKKINSFHQLYPSQSRLDLKHIPDDDVQIYFNAANCAVFPFKNITNSGSVFLAASFKKPFIAPDIGSLHDFPRDAGIFYDPSDVCGLQTSIESAIRRKRSLPKYGLRGFQYVNALSWRMIAEKTMKVYRIAGNADTMQHYDYTQES